MQFWSSLKKFTRAYLFQIAREKSCDYLYIIEQFSNDCWKKNYVITIAMLGILTVISKPV